MEKLFWLKSKAVCVPVYLSLSTHRGQYGKEGESQKHSPGMTIVVARPPTVLYGFLRVDEHLETNGPENCEKPSVLVKLDFGENLF